MNKSTKKSIENFIGIAFISIKNLFEPKVFKWIICTSIITFIALLICLLILSSLLVNLIAPYISGIPLIGKFVTDYVFFGMLLTGIFISNIFFAPLATTIFSLFQEKVISAIETKYFSNQNLESKTFTMLFAGFKILIWSILINFILFPISLIWGGSILWVPTYILIIGYLIAKEYSEAINLRRNNFDQCKILKSTFFWEYWIIGIIAAVLFLIPIFNLLVAPYISIFMVHLLNKNLKNGPTADN